MLLNTSMYIIKSGYQQHWSFKILNATQSSLLSMFTVTCINHFTPNIFLGEDDLCQNLNRGFKACLFEEKKRKLYVLTMPWIQSGYLIEVRGPACLIN